jgi:PAS domain S-box-containing protein
MNNQISPSEQRHPSANERFAAPHDWAALIIEGVDEVLFSVDREWRFTYVNAQASVILERPKEALLGRNMWEVFPALLGSSFELLYRQAMADGKPGLMEAFSPTAQAWYDVRAYLLPHGLIINFKDNTSRKRAEAETRLLAERAQVQAEVSRALAEVTHDYQSTLDTAARQLASVIGDACLIRLLSADGASLELAAVHHPDPQAAAFAGSLFAEEGPRPIAGDLAPRVVQTGESLLLPTISSEQLRALSDPRYWPILDRFAITSVLYTPLRATGRVIGVLVMARIGRELPYTEEDQRVVQDLADRAAIAITNARLLRQIQSELAERVRVEEALRTSEARFTGIVASAMDAIISIDESQRIVVFNAAAEKMFRCTASAVIGQPIDQFVPPAAREIHARHIRAFGQTGDTSRSVHSLSALMAVRADGEEFPIEATISQALAGGERLYTVVMRDISERRQAEEALQRTQAQLLRSQRMESIGQLAGGIAHDFNNLLVVIAGYCELMLEDLRQENPYYAELREIQKAGDRAASLVRQILAFSRQQVLQPQVVSLNETVANVDKLLHRVIGEDIELLSMLDPHLNPVFVDPGQIEQVIVNLVVNARDAMPGGGRLTIETANAELDAQYGLVGHPDVKAGSYVMLSVSDTGRGMDQATQDRIFEPFFTTKEPGKGTGLGLATVYGIVRQSEGYVWVYSEVGIGTTFKVYIPTVEDVSPAQPNAPGDEHVRQSASAAARRSSTILVVEDDAAIRGLIRQVLSQAGYAVLTAQHGQEALDVLQAGPDAVAMVLTDIVMPQMSGRELLVHLKRDWPHVKTLCMSGYTDRAIERQGALSPFDTFLQKPFTPAALLRRIDDVLLNGR